MYRILLIETGEYLYKSKNPFHLKSANNIYSKEEILEYEAKYEPIEIATITEAEQLLFCSCKIRLNGEFITTAKHLILFEIVEV